MIAVHSPASANERPEQLLTAIAEVSNKRRGLAEMSIQQAVPACSAPDAVLRMDQQETESKAEIQAEP